MSLRDYQAQGIEDLALLFSKGKKRVIYQASTGAGKTKTFSAISKRYIDKNEDSVLIVVHRIELLRQTVLTLFKDHNIVATEIQAGIKDIRPSRVYVAMAETIFRRINKIKDIGLLIIDECHIANFNKIIDNLNAKYTIGVTATPISSNKKEPLIKRFECIACAPPISELIKMGFLSQNYTWCPKTSVHRSELKMKGDDFDEVEMGKTFSKPKYVNNTVDAYERFALNKKTVIFNVNISHSLAVTQAFIEKGYDCRHLDGSTPHEERERLFLWLRNTKNAILCNVGVATTGFDDDTIECIIMNRATESLSLWLQITGRGSRITPFKKIFTIIDMGENAITHGDWCDDRNWKDIFFNPPKKKGNKPPPSKSCPVCEIFLHAAVRKCHNCGYEYPPIKEAIEKSLNGYILFTKNIDVPKLIEETSQYQPYYSWFKLINIHATKFKQEKKKCDDEIFNFVKEQLFKDCKKWCKEQGKQFNLWHRNFAETELRKLIYKESINQENDRVLQLSNI